MQTTKHAEIDSAIAQVAAGLTQLRALMQDPSDLSFELLHPHFEHLERALGNKAAIDAAFAFIAERDDAGRRVGSSKAKDYLTARLGLSESEAAARLRNGRNLFAPIPEPEPTPPPADPDADDATRAQAEEEARRRADRERREEEKRRKKLFEEEPIPERILNLIENELRSLSKYAIPGPSELRNQALEQAKRRSFDSLREWLRKAVRKANKHALNPAGEPIRTPLPASGALASPAKMLTAVCISPDTSTPPRPPSLPVPLLPPKIKAATISAPRMIPALMPSAWRTN